MTAEASQSAVLRFGPFGLDVRAGELRRGGSLVKLQHQPLTVLVMLASRAGEVVTRDELRHEIWGDHTFVDFDRSVNFCIRQIRSALDDDADAPRYVETLPKRGYRFIAPVDADTTDFSPQSRAPAIAPAAREQRVRATSRRRVATIAAVAILVSIASLEVGLLQPRREAPPPRMMLVVLPFENLTGAADQEYLIDGFTEEMTTELGHLQPARLGVIARTSAMRYKRTDKPIKQIGRELGVNYLLEGSIRRAGDRLRISAQLIRANDETHVWAETYERELRDLFAVERDVVLAIADGIQLTLTIDKRARLRQADPIDRAAHDEYLRGRYQWNKMSEEGFRASVAHFERASRRDPQYTLAHVGLADAYNMLGVYGAVAPTDAFTRAKAAATRAIALDDQLGEAHASLALALLDFDWDWTDAQKEFERALALNPSYALGRRWYSVYLEAMTRLDDALAETRRAATFDPLSLIAQADVGWVLYQSGQYDAAIEQCQRTLELDGQFFVARRYLGMALEQKQRHAAAVAELRRAVDESGRAPVYLASLAHASAAAGDRVEALKLIDELKALSAKRYVSPISLAVAYAGLDDVDQAVSWLEKGYQDRGPGMIRLNIGPQLASLRRDPRFADLVRRVGLP